MGDVGRAFDPGADPRDSADRMRYPIAKEYIQEQEQCIVLFLSAFPFFSFPFCLVPDVVLPDDFEENAEAADVDETAERADAQAAEPSLRIKQ